MVRGPIDAMLREAVVRAAAQHGWVLPESLSFVIEAPKDPALGDAATNLAMSLAKPLGQPSLRIAEAIAQALPEDQAIADVSVAPPGFLNFRLRHPFLLDALRRRMDEDSLEDCDRHLKLGTLVADHVNEAIASGRVPPHPDAWSPEERAGVSFHLLAHPVERIEWAAVRRETLDNPWFYVRQARDRMASVLTTAADEGLRPAPESLEAGSLQAPEERRLLVLVAGVEGEVTLALERKHPQRLARAATELALGFHQFYAACRVFGENRSEAEARLALIAGTHNGLSALISPLENADFLNC